MSSGGSIFGTWAMLATAVVVVGLIAVVWGVMSGKKDRGDQ